MEAPELVALLAGVSVLLVMFAVAQIATSSALQTRLKLFVRRDPIIMPATVRRQQKQSRLAAVDAFNRRLRKANFAKKLQKDLIRAGVDMQASRFIMLQVAIAGVTFVGVYFVLDTIKDLEGMGSLLIASAVAVLAWFIPMFVLSFL